jgi:ABC-type glutathione transport system ATPase component
MTRPSSEMLHASTVAIDGQAVLITGVSGSGKSDLALRLIDRGASSPARIKGKLEVRGIGVIDCAAFDSAPAALIVRIDEVPLRMPEDSIQIIAGISLPTIALAPFEASAPIKVELALRQVMAR